MLGPQLWARAGPCHRDGGLAVILPSQKQKEQITKHKHPSSPRTYQKPCHLGRMRENQPLGGHLRLPRLVEQAILSAQATDSGEDLRAGGVSGGETPECALYPHTAVFHFCLYHQCCGHVISHL